MFESISWYQYLSAIGIIVIVWYTICIILFYRKSIDSILKGELKLKTFLPKKFTHVLNRNAEGPAKGSFDELEKLVWDIKINILEKAGTEAQKDWLLGQLQSKVANYDGLRQPAYRNALNNFIINHTQTICGLVIREDELEEVWENVTTNNPAGSES